MPDTLDRLNKALAGRYEIQRVLGRGGMAVVYLARDLRHSRMVAIKVLKDELSHGVAADRFLSEITIAAGLVHPHLLPVFDSGGDSECLYYVMPYVEGESLRVRLQRDGRLPLDHALRIAQEVGEALAYAHARGVVHRDIKPENILLVQGHAVVADFGIARAIQQAGGARVTMAGLAVGTPLYMSPEQANGSPDVDGRSDVFSLACVLYEMLSGQAPHAGDTPRHVIARKFTDVSESLFTNRAGMPAGVAQALKHALATNPAQRVKSAADFVAELSGEITTVAPPFPSPSHTSRRPRIVAGAIGLAIVAVLALVAWRARTSARATNPSVRLGVAVFPFHATDAGAAEWEEAIPDLLATALDGIPGVVVADPLSVWRNLRPDPHAHARSPAPDEAAMLAQRAGSRYFILGSIAQLAGDVQVNVRMYRSGAADPWQTFAITGPRDSLTRVIRQVSLEAIRRFTLGGEVIPATVIGLAQGLTQSPEALKLWLAARESRRRGQLDSAEVAIDRALSLDSTFVRASVDAIVIKSLLQFSRGTPYANLRELAQRAVRMSDSLPERLRLHADALLASIETDGGAAAFDLNHVLANDSTDFDAWSLLSYVQNAYGWQYGAATRDAIISGEHAVRLDSTDAPALVRRAYLALAENDSQDIARQVARLRRADSTSSLVRGMLRAVDALETDDRSFPARGAQLATVSIPEWITVLRMVRMYRPDRAELLVDQARRQSSPIARFALGATIQVLASEGRWRALDSLRRAGVFAVGAGLERNVDRMIVAGAIGASGDDPLARRAVATLAADLPPDSARAWINTRQVWQDGWLIASFNAMFGDTMVARTWQAALGTLPTKDAYPARYTSALRDDIAARLASRRGDRQNALRYAHQAYDAWSVHTENQYEHTPEPAMRFHLAMLLRLSGAADSAAALFRSLEPPTTWMGFYTSRAALELGELAEARGDLATARRSFLTASRSWERGDSSVASLRERARRGVSRLSGETRR